MKLKLFFLMSLVFFTTSVQAELTLEAVVEQIQQKYNATDTLEVNFTQTAYNKALNQTQSAQGMLYIKKPGMMRWDYITPEEQSFIINDKTFWWYTPQNRQVVKKESQSAFDSNLPLAFISGIGRLSQDFNIKFAAEQYQQDMYVLDMLPKKPQVNINRMLFKVDKKQFDIQEVIMYDFYENVTTIKFAKHSINKPIDTERFHFEVPPGVRIVE